jgi:hypothetical protein
MRTRRARRHEGFFRPFWSWTPNKLSEAWPSPGFAILWYVLDWQAKKAVAKKAAEEAAQVHSHTWMQSFSE